MVAFVGHGQVHSVTVHAHPVGFTGQTFQNYGRDVPSAVHAVVNNKRFFIQLCVEQLGEHVQSLG